MLKLLACLGLFFALSFLPSAAPPSLRTQFYHKTCPSAETIVTDVVNQAYARDSGIAPALIRLHFHDCFVHGCDTSILLDSKITQKSEKESPMNKGVHGFHIIDKAKALIEAECPATVSCADIVAFAARDGVVKASGLHYSVPGGRRDGRISLIEDAAKNLPGESFNVTQLKLNFTKKGLSLAEMVTLSGAHSIGESHCSSFRKRLYRFNETRPQDPAMDAAYAGFLKRQCRNGSDIDINPLVAFDPTTPGRLDVSYYKNLMRNRGLLTSDQALWNTPGTRGMVKKNGEHGHVWAAGFARAMVKMGKIGVLTGKRGEVRNTCRLVN